MWLVLLNWPSNQTFSLTYLDAFNGVWMDRDVQEPGRPLRRGSNALEMEQARVSVCVCVGGGG